MYSIPRFARSPLAGSLPPRQSGLHKISHDSRVSLLATSRVENPRYILMWRGRGVVMMAWVRCELSEAVPYLEGRKRKGLGLVCRGSRPRRYGDIDATTQAQMSSIPMRLRYLLVSERKRYPLPPSNSGSAPTPRPPVLSHFTGR